MNCLHGGDLANHDSASLQSLLLPTTASDRSGHGLEAADRPGRREARYFCSVSFSMPLVAPAPGLVVQQKTESSPHWPQTCLTSSCFPLPVPATVIVLLHPG